MWGQGGSCYFHFFINEWWGWSSLRRQYLNQDWKDKEVSHGAIWKWVFLAEGTVGAKALGQRSVVAQRVKNGKESACNAGDPGLTPGWGRPPGEGNGYLLQYSCLENPMDRGAWQATSQSQRVRHDWATNTFTFQFQCGRKESAKRCGWGLSKGERLHCGPLRRCWLLTVVKWEPLQSIHPMTVPSHIS